MNIRFSISGTLVNAANQFVVAAYNASNPTFAVETIVPVKGGSSPYYTNPFQVTFLTLNYGTVYIFKLWESTDGTASGVVRNRTSFTALAQSVSVRADLHLYGDQGLPGLPFPSGQGTYTDASLIGWTWRTVREGQGPLDPNTQVTDGTDSFTLATNVNTDEHIILEFFPQLATITPPVSFINSFKLITANTTLDNTYANKEIICNAAIGGSLICPLPSLATVNDFDLYPITTIGNIGINYSFPCYNTDKIQRDTLIGGIVLGQNESCTLMKITISGTAYWYVMGDLVGMDRVGQIIYSSTLSVPNTLPWNGQQVPRATYIRLTSWILAKGPMSTDSQWLTGVDANGNYIYHGYYSPADGSTNIQLPIANKILKPINGTARGASSFQDWQAIDHQHESTIAQLATTLFGRGKIARLLGKYSGTQTVVTDLTSSMVDSTGANISRSGSEPYEKNNGVYVLVYI